VPFQKIMSAVMIKAFALGAGLLVSACLVDTDEPCGESLVKTDAGACVCPDRTVPVDGKCLPCGENEHPNGAQCVCDDGFARPAAAAACEPSEAEPTPTPTPDGLGQSCASNADCAGTAATYCDVFATLTCVIEGCKEQSGVCPGDMTCCDYAILSRSLCVPASALTNDDCPAPGRRIDRE
jgi:hypothetical protein